MADTFEYTRDNKPLDGKGLKKVLTLLNNDFEAVESKISDLTERQDALELGSLGNYTYCVAGWKVGDMKPEAIEQYGNPDLLRRWDFYFCDHSKVNSTGDAIIPNYKLKRNNLFRTENGHYAKTVFTNYNCKGLYNISGNQNDGFTANSAFANGENKLYTTAACTEPYYCLAKDFDPKKFWEEYGHEGGLWMKTPGGQGPYQLFELPRPWEEYQSWEGLGSSLTPYNDNPDSTVWGGFGEDYTDRTACKSVVMSYPKTCYLVDQIEGTTGVKWKGIFFEPVIWDGIDVSKYPLDPTGIGPTPSTAFAPNGTSSTATNGDRMFTRYIDFYKEFATGKGGVKMGSNCQGHLGEGNCSKAFMSEDWTIDGETYKRFAYGRSYDVSQLTNCNMARNNNADPEASAPFAEGGYHSRNTFVSSQETIYRTKYLNDTNFFASGISANDAVANEAAWKKYGGIRWKRNGTSDWNYGTWNTTPTVSSSAAQSIRYNADTATHFNALLSWWFPKEQVLESQTAASYAVEAGIEPGVEFQFGAAGNAKPVTWWYADVPGAPGLQKGEMNCIIYKKFLYSLKAFDGTGASATFDVEVILRMSLMNGYNHSGDYWIYYGGGYEQVGTNLFNDASTSGTTGNPVDIYTCFDQRKWRSRTDLQAVTKPNMGTFDFESDPNYWKCWSGVNLGDSYTGVRPSYTAYKEATASALNQGECFWSYTSNHWDSTPGTRVRVGVRRRGGGFAKNTDLGIIRGDWSSTIGGNVYYKDIGGSEQLRLDI